MFPHPCGEQFERAVAAGADPRAVVPDEYVVVRGGLKPVPPPGEMFSCATGPDLPAAAAAVPHGNVRATTAAAVRSAGGLVVWVPDISPHGTMSFQHVDVTEAGPTCFPEPIPNPVPRRSRIDEGK